MIYFTKDGPYFGPINIDNYYEQLYSETKSIVLTICDFIAGVKNSKGFEKEFEGSEELTTTEKIFIHHYNKMYETNLKLETIIKKKVFMNFRFFLYESDDPLETPVLCPYMNDHMTYSIFIPTSIQENEDSLIQFIYHWIDMILVLKIQKESKNSDNFKFSLDFPSIVLSDDFGNPNFIRFFIDYYRLLLDIFIDICNVDDLDFGKNNPATSWNNLAQFLKYMEDVQMFGLNFSKAGSVLDQEVMYLHAILYEICKYNLSRRINDQLGLYFRCIDILNEPDINSLDYIIDMKEEE